MEDQEKAQQEAIQRHLAAIEKSAERHPEIAGRIENILRHLSNIVFTLEAQNAKPKQVEKQLSAAELLLEGIQTMGRLNTDIPEAEPGAKLAKEVSESIRARVGRAGGLPDWMKK